MMTSHTVMAAACAICATSGAAAIAQAPTPASSPQMVHYDPKRFSGEPRPTPFEAILVPTYDSERTWTLSTSDGIPEPDHLEDLTHSLHSRLFENELVSINRQGPYFVLAGQPKHVVEAAETIRAVANHWTRGIRVRLRAYSVDADKVSTSGTTPEELRECAKGLLWSQDMVIHPGAIVQTGRATTHFVVNNAEGEIAQEASLIRPVSGQFETGIHVGLEVHPVLRDEGFALFVQGSFSDRDKVTTRIATGMESVPTLDRPEIMATAATMAGVVKNGGELAFLSSGDPARGSNLLFTVSASWSDPMQFDNQRVSIIPVGALTTPALATHHNPRFSSKEEPPYELLPTLSESEHHGMNAETLHDLIYQTFMEDFDNESLSMDFAGSWLIVQGDFDQRIKLEAFVRHLETQTLQGGVLEWTQSSEEHTDTAPHRLVLPVLVDRHAFVMRRNESKMLFGWDAMVAQDSHLLIPTVGTLVRGSLFSTMTRRTGAQSWNATIGFEQIDGPNPRVSRLDWDHGGNTEKISLTVQRLDSTGRAGKVQQLNSSGTQVDSPQLKSSWTVHMAAASDAQNR